MAINTMKHSSNLPELLILITVLSAIFIGILFKSQEHLSEGLESGLFNESKVEVNPDEYEFSKYGNISLSNDIDMSQQRVYASVGSPNDPIDNSDVIDMAVSKGSMLYQSINNNITPIKSTMSQDVLGSSGTVEYDIPMTGSQTIDEVLARKQQHRASINKKAIDGHVRSTKKIYEKYFKDELDENESKVWWSSEAQEIETDFTNY